VAKPPNLDRPLVRLGEVIAGLQADDPFYPVAVIVPSLFTRVQLRRAIGGTEGVCNVEFRTWGELTAELGRRAAGSSARAPTPRVVNEALRQVLSGTSSPFASFAHSPAARSELVVLLYELWRAGPSLLLRLSGRGGRAGSLVTTLTDVEAHLAGHGFADPGRLLDLAATAPVDRRSLGAIVRWYPSPVRGRDRAVLDHLEASGVTVTTISTGGGGAGAIERVVGCSDPDEEVRVMLRQVITAVEAGTPLWRQAIIHPAGERYRRIAHQQLADAGVASSGRSPMTLAQSISGTALAGLLELAGGAWRRADVMRWLESAPITDGRRGNRVPVSRWDAVSAKAGVIEGLDQWRTRLRRFAEGVGEGDRPTAQHDAERHSARGLAAFVDGLASELDPGCTRWSEWAAWGTRVLDRYLDPEDRSEEWPAAELVAARLVRELLADLGGLDDVGATADLVAFRHAVEDELASHPVRDDSGVARPASENDPGVDAVLDVALSGPVGSGVFVGSPTEARGLAFDRVHVVGMADQFLPGVAQQSALVPEAELGDDWPTNARRAEELLDDLRAVLELADGPAWVSWPRIDPRTGREHGRSRWLDAAIGLGGAWTEENVPSFEADLTGTDAASFPLSAADRLLSDLARAVLAGRPLEHHRAVIGADPTSPGRSMPPMGLSVAAARSPIGPGFSRFEGHVGPGHARGIDEELSATRLEAYATCPRKYLLERELGLSERFRPEAAEQIEPKYRGTLVHEILATYVGERINDGAPASLDRLIELAEMRFSVADQEGRCGPPLMGRVERATLIWELRRFFEEDTLEPVAVELGFGRLGAKDDIAGDRLEPSADVSSLGHSVGAVELELAGGRTVRFGGSVDRIDRAPSGSLVVSDYKTGREHAANALKSDPVAQGTRLQLALYALVARAYRESDGPVLARYWFTAWNREDETLSCTVDDTVLNRLREVVSTIADGIGAGAFPGVPGNVAYRPGRVTFDNCVYCDFDRLCPADRDRRWSTVQATAEVEPVIALLETPNDDLRGIVAPAKANLLGTDLPRTP
jgi:ATP-dependent helicase/nuclease subunit B